MSNLSKDLADEFRSFVVGIFLFAWWVGGPGVTAILWTGDEHRLAMGFLAGWAVLTVVYLVASRLIRRRLKKRRPA